MSSLQDIKLTKTPITLDKPRTLCYDLNAFAALEEETGKSAEAIIDLAEKGNIKAIRDIIWAGLVHEDEEITPKQVGALIGVADLPGVAEVLGKALGSAMPQQKKVKNK